MSMTDCEHSEQRDLKPIFGIRVGTLFPETHKFR